MNKEINILNGWKEVKLGEVCNINTNSLTDRTDENFSFYYVDLSMVNDGVIEYPSNQILFKNSPSRARRIFKKSDILMSTVRPNLLGHAIIKSEVKNCICSTGFAVIEKKNGLSYNEYIYPNLFSYNIRKQIDSILVGSNYPAINSNDIKNLKILLPPLPEQKAIADTLEKWDEAIEKTSKLIEAKKNKFEWLCYRVIGKIKKTKNMKFGNFLTESRIRDIENNPQKRITVRLHLKGVEVRDYRGTEIDGATQYFIRSTGQLIYGKQNIFKGSIGIVPSILNGYSSSQDIPAFDIDESIDSEWLFYYISRPSFYKKLEHYSTGSGSKRVHPKELFKIQLLIPHYQQQRQIAKTLNTAKKEITILEGILAKYKNQKKGLMQKLLTGKIRVNNINSIN